MSECYCSMSVGVTHCLAVAYFSNEIEKAEQLTLDSFFGCEP